MSVNPRRREKASVRKRKRRRKFSKNLVKVESMTHCRMSSLRKKDRLVKRNEILNFNNHLKILKTLTPRKPYSYVHLLNCLFHPNNPNLLHNPLCKPKEKRNLSMDSCSSLRANTKKMQVKPLYKISQTIKGN